jgi:hypothetical protein
MTRRSQNMHVIDPEVSKFRVATVISVIADDVNSHHP